MKMMTKVIPVVTMIVTTILLLFFMDIYQSKNYINVSNDKHGQFAIHYNEDISIDSEVINRVLDVASKYNVIIQKLNYDINDSSVKNVYLSLPTMEKLIDFMSDKLDVVTLKNYEFISTYKSDNRNDVAFIQDLFENDKYNYYLFDTLLKSDGNLYGNYIIYYQNEHDYQNFIEEIKGLLGDDITSYTSNNQLPQIMIITIMISIAILMLFYFVFQIFEIYNKSSDIACMKLLGFSKIKITHYVLKKRLFVYIIINIFILLTVFLLIQNISWIQLILVFIILSLIILLTYFISYICVFIVSKNYQLSNILKRQNIVLKIVKISIQLKVIIAILLVIFLSFVFKELAPIYQDLAEYRKSKNLLKYGVLTTIQGDSKELYEYEKHSDFYKNIVNDKRLKTIYADFGAYKEGKKEDQSLIQKLESKNKYFRYASVDKNYLEKEHIQIFDLNLNQVNVDDLKGVYFLFPKSKKNKISEFQKYYQTQSQKDYEKYQLQQDFHVYLYSDQVINTYLFQEVPKQISSPILRVIDPSLTISYIESPLGISMFGIGLSTSLKFEINNSEKETFNIIEDSIKKAGLETVIHEKSFVSYKQYFQEQMKLSQMVVFVVFCILGIIYFVYFLLTMQTITLYVKSNQKKVLVAYLLGYDKNKIFHKLIIQNICSNLVVFIISVVFLNIINNFYLFPFVLSFAIFLMVDTIIIFITIGTYKISSVALGLKGENYD